MIDILLIVVFGVAVLTGLRRGLIGQVASIAAVVLSIVACRMFGGVLAGAFGFLVPASLECTPMAGFIPAVASNTVIYTAVYYAVKFFAGALRATARMLLMGPLDRVGGAIFSVFKWGFGLSVALNLWLAVCPTSDFVKRSTIGGGVAVENLMELAPWVWGIATDLCAPDSAPAENTQGGSGVVNM